VSNIVGGGGGGGGGGGWVGGGVVAWVSGCLDACVRVYYCLRHVRLDSFVSMYVRAERKIMIVYMFICIYAYDTVESHLITFPCLCGGVDNDY